MAVAAGCLVSTALAASPAPCGQASDQRVAQQGWVLAWRSEPSPLPVGQPFALRGQLCAPPGQRATALRVDADMPAHRHGMNYRARTELGADGQFHSQGLLWHMPGRWRLLFEVQTDSGPLRLQHEVMLR
jgi:hypothetical protein